MEPLAYIIAILGCADDGSLCTEQRRGARFVTYQACAAQLDAEIARNSDLPFPIIEGRCERRGPQMVSRSGRTPA